ncbi:MAG TPA: c-type cytochrome [Candidatus Angelobacter sp.]
MKPIPPNGLLLIACAAVITMIVFMGATHPPRDAVLQEGNAQSQNQKDKNYERLIPSLQGADLFRSYCAPCHGATGRGDGPVVPALKNPVPDLTTIAQRNSGNFPAARVQDIIAGDHQMAAHGSREMPIWGPIFHQVEYDRDYGNIRLKNLVDYIRSIQQK